MTTKIPTTRRAPIPTKPRPKAKAKRKGKARMVTAWAFTVAGNPMVAHACIKRSAARYQRTYCRLHDGDVCGPHHPHPAPCPGAEGRWDVSERAQPIDGREVLLRAVSTQRDECAALVTRAVEALNKCSAAYDSAREQHGIMVEQVKAITAQRDALLEALRDLADTNNDFSEALVRARSAIARAEGKT